MATRRAWSAARRLLLGLGLLLLGLGLGLGLGKAAAQTSAQAAAWSQLASFPPAVRPVRVALAVDEHSMKDIPILINSVINSAYNKRELVFHLLVCGKDELTARRLRAQMEERLVGCFAEQRFEIKSFVLPPDSGFGAQLSALKKKAHHWNSPSGADMARFFLAKEFPHAERLLYLDNDIVVSCCLEEIFDSALGDAAVGVALDDLNWAVVTQFVRHYNASHPLVIENMRRNQSTAYQRERRREEVSKQEFAKAVPRYPNDGVLLIDVKRFNALGVLAAMDRIAQANGDGEYAVGLGTQQFTVLALHDRWAELTPRANLRHFPDMARGYLMWFYYTGVLHYAGAAKPRTLCHVDSFKDNNWHRVQSLTPWLVSHYAASTLCAAPLADATSASQPAGAAGAGTLCSRHLVHARNWLAFVRALLLLVEHTGHDRELLYLRLGPPRAALDVKAYEQDLAAMLKAVAPPAPALPITVNSSQLSCSALAQTPAVDLAAFVDRMALHGTQWDVRVFAAREAPELRERLQLFNVTYPSASLSAADALSPVIGGKKKKPAGPARKGGKQVRRVATVVGSWCRNFEPAAVYVPAELLRGFSTNGQPCQSVLLEIKAAGYRHWEPVVITADLGANEDTLAAVSALEFAFVRPKAMVITLRRQDTEGEMRLAIARAQEVLERAGFMVGMTHPLDCLPVEVQVWGVRMNFLEFV